MTTVTRHPHHHPHHPPQLPPPANTIAGQVLRQVRDVRVRLAMLMAPYLEGGGATPLGAGGWGVGDNGNSHGAYQINLPYHPGVTAAKADNPRFAVGYMRPAYAHAARSVPARLWRTNPTLAAEKTVQRAENPAQSYYASHGTRAVNMAYRDAVRASTKGGAGVGGTGSATLTAAGFKLPSIPGGIPGIGGIPGLPGGGLGGAAGGLLGGLGGLGGGAGGVVGGAVSGLFAPLITFLTKGIFVAGGAGLVVLGASMTARQAGVPVAAVAAMGA